VGHSDLRIKVITNNKLKFNPHKTIAMLVTKKKTIITPKIQMNMEDIKIVDQFSYLGVILDKKITFKPHLEILAKKASQFQFALERARKPTWGINSEALHTIYYGAFEPMVLYCVSAFQHVLDKKWAQNKLYSVVLFFRLRGRTEQSLPMQPRL
jgi:2'-5' RNA ligase